MAPIQKIQTDAKSGGSRPSAGPSPSEKAPTNAPTQTSAVTGKGVQQKTAPTFNQSPTLAPKPADNGSVNIISDQRQPVPKGPANAAQIYGGQGQQP